MDLTNIENFDFSFERVCLQREQASDFAKKMKEIVRGDEKRISEIFSYGYYRGSSHAFSNLYKALVAFSETGDMETPIEITWFSGHSVHMFLRPENKIKSVFDMSIQKGCLQDTIAAVQENPSFESSEKEQMANLALKIIEFLKTIIPQEKEKLVSIRLSR